VTPQPLHCADGVPVGTETPEKYRCIQVLEKKEQRSLLMYSKSSAKRSADKQAIEPHRVIVSRTFQKCWLD